MSVLLRPQIKPEKAVMITTAAAVSVCEALEKVGASSASIKWVNDIFVNRKKVCGILTEAGFDSNGKLSFAVLGVGLNMYEPTSGFPDEIKDIAGAVFSEKQEGLEDRFIAGFLNAFYEFYVDITSKKHIAEYKRLCFLYGREVDVIKGDSVRQARVSGLDDNCGLIVEYADGEKDVLTSGEVSLKVKK
jgi:BirA family biotin operon repressor/biotin-[acetyl-CoA-carboxylase] ligase